MNRNTLRILIPALVLFLTACQAPGAIPANSPTPSQKGAPSPIAPVGVVQSDKVRAISTDLSSDVPSLTAGNRAFAFDLYRMLRQNTGNLFYSPHSMSLALAMTYAGARGQTADQMAQVLHMSLPQDRLHPAVNSLDQELARRTQGGTGKDGKGFRLNIVNALWGQVGYKFQPQFLDVLAANYGAGLRTMDFVRAAEPSRMTINKWVEEQTENRIKDLIPSGGVDASTRLVLTNAIYFNAAWLHQFEQNATADGPLTLLDGSKVTVPMMRQTESFRYASGADYQAVELPYEGGKLAMLIILPASGQFDKVDGSLTAAQYDGIVSSLQYKRVFVTLPKFKYETTLALQDPLGKLGMQDAFVPGTADFSGMDGTRDLFISAVLHKAFVAVDEAGTEAAAATAVIVAAGAMPSEPVQFKADRPFIFAIRDLDTGALLFLGRVVNPAG